MSRPAWATKPACQPIVWIDAACRYTYIPRAFSETEEAAEGEIERGMSCGRDGCTSHAACQLRNSPGLLPRWRQAAGKRGQSPNLLGCKEIVQGCLLPGTGIMSCRECLPAITVIFVHFHATTIGCLPYIEWHAYYFRFCRRRYAFILPLFGMSLLPLPGIFCLQECL